MASWRVYIKYNLKLKKKINLQFDLKALILKIVFYYNLKCIFS